MIAQQLTAKIAAKVGDITQEEGCAIVNAANSSLLGGGGVDGAIHRAGGSAILAACRELRASHYPDGLPTGEAVATTAGEMPAAFVIHTVGPIYSRCDGRCSELLKRCYVNSIEEALKVGCDSIVFPAISTGIYGYPKRAAAKVAFDAVQEALSDREMKVTFIFHSQSGLETFLKSIT